MIYVTDFSGNTDSERIEAALAAKGTDGTVVFTAKADGTPWRLDRAVLLPSDTTVVIRDCRIKLSDACRDNLFRSANCGIGIEAPTLLSHICLRGEGEAVLEGADRPRATGDATKLLADPCPVSDAELCQYGTWIPEERRAAGKPDFWDKHNHSFGTDCKKAGEAQQGDWRNAAILLANVDGFSVEHLRIVDAHGSGIVVEAGQNGVIRGVDFDCRMTCLVDGMLQNVENQNGIDLRNGCHHIEISDVTGITGNDVVALTALALPAEQTAGGRVGCACVLPTDWSARETDIHHITVKQIRATSALCWLVRLYPKNSCIYDVVLEDIVDTATEPTHFGGVILGERGATEADRMERICLRRLDCNTQRHGVGIEGYLVDADIEDVICRNAESLPVELVNKDLFWNLRVTRVG